MKKATWKEVLAKKEQLIKEHEEKEKKIEQYAESIGWEGYIKLDSTVETARKFNTFINDLGFYHYPYASLELGNITEHELQRYQDEHELNLVSYCNIIEYLPVKKQLKIQAPDPYRYDTPWEYLKIDTEKQTVKDYVNGNAIIQLTNEQFKVIDKLIRTPYALTTKILKLIEKDKDLQKDLIEAEQAPYMNMWCILGRVEWIKHNTYNVFLVHECVKALCGKKNTSVPLEVTA